MKVSMKTDYGLRALTYLAQRYGQGSVQSSDIAAHQAIPEPYLDQLLTTLRKAGFINSRRGPQGGHVLARTPDEIAVGEVVLALEGSLAPLSCLEEQTGCFQGGGCAQREMWQAVQQATEAVLNATTIGELAKRQLSRQQRAMYSI